MLVEVAVQIISSFVLVSFFFDLLPEFLLLFSLASLLLFLSGCQGI